MTEPDYLARAEPSTVLAFMREQLSDRKRRLFVCAWCRACELLSDDLSRTAIEVSERYADGLATEEELLATRTSVNGRIKQLRGVAEFDIEPLRTAYEAAGKSMRTVAAAVWWLSARPFSRSEGAVLELLRDFTVIPFRPVARNPGWITSTVHGLAEGIYTDRAFDRLPILADALEDAGCDSADILTHCRGDGPHVRGCWVVDWVLGKK